MKRFIAIAAGLAVAVTASVSLAGSASAAGESVAAGLTLSPQAGQLSKTERKDSIWQVDVEINAPFPASPKVLPLKRIRTTFPLDMTFNPKPSTPVCSDSAVGPDADLNFEPNTVINRCPKAVLGNGNAELYLAGNNSAGGPTLQDAVLIVFNGGRNGAGQPKLKIYGYSAGTGVGIYMEGVLDDGVLDVAIPRLAFDSGTGVFSLNIPGAKAPQENRHGVDKSYIQARCSTGTWVTDAQLTLGTRDSAGNPTSPDVVLDAETDVDSCTGVGTGRGRFGSVKARGPGRVEKGARGTYKVTVTNTGSGTIKKLKVKATGKGVKGSGTAGDLPRGKSKTVSVEARFSREGRIKTTFKATGKNSSNSKAVKRTVEVE
ncbi:MAG: hypothetical protein ACSLFD_00450 [Solirubrobacterales bacterium]